MKKRLNKQLPQTKSVQCKDTTLRHTRCKKRTQRTKQCWIHLLKNRNLRIKKSTIPNAGLGLFAGKKTKKGTSLGFYTG